jgi:hypothetical protein
MWPGAAAMNARLLPATRVLIVLALTALSTTVAWGKLESPAIGIDDANIFFVYARNVSAWEGFVFNPGGERVEGFTSLLWVLISAVATSIFGHPEFALLAFNVLLVSLALAACLRDLPVGWASALVILVVGSISYIVWHTVSLMETALWSALLTVAVLMGAGRGLGRTESARFACMAALLVLTRPEAFVWVPVLIGTAYFSRSAGEKYSAALRFNVPAALAFAVTAGLLTIFRLVYFGFPLPNTYYAKLSPSVVYRLAEGMKYLASFIVSSPIVMAATVAVLASIAHLLNDRMRDRRTLALTLAAATGLVLPVLTGGDHFDGYRFYQPIYPVLVLTLLNFIRTVMPRYIPVSAAARVNSRVKLVAAAAALGTAVVSQTVTWLASDRSTLLGREFDIAEAGRQLGGQANAVFGLLEPLPGIATITVGGLKYGYHGPVIDLMGLNLTLMAHNGGNRMGVRSHAAFELHTFFELQPPIVVPLVQFNRSVADLGRRDPFADRVLKGLLEQPQFRRQYQLAEVRRATATGAVALAAWYDRDFLESLRHVRTLQVTVAGQDY